MERIKVEQAKLADGSIQKTFLVKCSVCGEIVFINTITKNPKEYDYFCLNCGQFVEQDVMDEIIRMIDSEWIMGQNFYERLRFTQSVNETITRIITTEERWGELIFTLLEKQRDESNFFKSQIQDMLQYLGVNNVAEAIDWIKHCLEYKADLEVELNKQKLRINELEHHEHDLVQDNQRLKKLTQSDPNGYLAGCYREFLKLLWWPYCDEIKLERLNHAPLGEVEKVFNSARNNQNNAKKLDQATNIVNSFPNDLNSSRVVGEMKQLLDPVEEEESEDE